MKLTRHNGRAGKNGVYNPRHNDRSFDVSGSKHIDEERMKKNIYWDYYHGYSSWESRNENNKEELALRFEEVEKMFYFDQYFFSVQNNMSETERAVIPSVIVQQKICG